MHRLSSVLVAMTLACGIQVSTASAAGITIPAGYGAVLSSVTDGGCDVVEYGYLVSGASDPVHVDTHRPVSSCGSSSLASAVVPSASSPQSLLVYIQDDSCASSIYWSDGTGTVDHAFVAGSNPYTIYLDDAGGSCVDQTAIKIPTASSYNFTATVTVTPPPKVSVVAPAPPSGQAGYFNNQDLRSNGGGVPVSVSAADQSSSGLMSLACSDDGSAVTVSGITGAGTASMKGTVKLSGDGIQNIVCTATDNAGGTGNAGGTNSATVAIDSTAPTVLVPASPVIVGGTAAGALVSDYQVSAADADAGDTPTLSCNPATPAHFPVGDSTVVCQATDRAGNTAQAQFVVRVLPSIASFGSVTTSGPTAEATVDCSGVIGQLCEGQVTATTRVTRRRGKAVAVSAAGSEPATRTKTIVVARSVFSVAGGKTGLARISLNRIGKQLLADFYRLPAELALPGGTRRVVTFAYARIHSAVAYTWLFKAAYTTTQQLSVSPLPAGGRVLISCHGGGCPFTQRVLIPHKKQRVVLTALLAGSRLSPGTTLQLVITAHDSIGKVLIFAMQHGRPPTVITRCLPPGYRHPLACASPRT